MLFLHIDEINRKYLGRLKIFSEGITKKTGKVAKFFQFSFFPRNWGAN